MSRFVKLWLGPFDWKFVTEINCGLCRQKNALRKLAELSPGLAADQSFILRSIAGHIVAGTATDIERKQLDSILDALGK